VCIVELGGLPRHSESSPGPHTAGGGPSCIVLSWPVPASATAAGAVLWELWCFAGSGSGFGCYFDE
jgi:hypothetical protein